MITLCIEIRRGEAVAWIDPGGYVGSAARIDAETALAEFRRRSAAARGETADLTEVGLCQHVLQRWYDEAMRVERLNR